MLAAMLAIFTAGGTEIVMNQYVTTFSQKSLGFDKATSDLVGMGLFAVMMGIARTGYGILGDRLDMNKALIVGSFASFVLYLVVGCARRVRAVRIFQRTAVAGHACGRLAQIPRVGRVGVCDTRHLR